MAARVMVSMLAATSGRLERQMLGEWHRQIDRAGVASWQHAILRCEQEVVKRAAAHELQQIHGLTSSHM